MWETLHVNPVKFVINVSVNNNTEDALCPHLPHLFGYRTPDFEVIEQHISVMMQTPACSVCVES